MGYNSQFDVDGRVDQVSEFLERDVDFDKWIKDIPDDDEDEPQNQSQTHSQNHEPEVGMEH